MKDRPSGRGFPWRGFIREQAARMLGMERPGFATPNRHFAPASARCVRVSEIGIPARKITEEGKIFLLFADLLFCFLRQCITCISTRIATVAENILPC